MSSNLYYYCYYYYLLKAYSYSPVNCKRSPQGFLQDQILHKLNTKHAHFTNVKHINII